MADYSPGSDKWTEEDNVFLVDQYVNANPVYWLSLQEYLRPLKDALAQPLLVRFRDSAATDSVQKASATALASYVEDGALLAELTSTATPAQYAILYPVLAERVEGDEQIKELLRTWTKEQPGEDFDEAQRLALGRKRGGAAINLLRMRQPQDALNVLRIQDDPESLTQFVHGCKTRGVTLAELLDLLNRSKPVTERYAVLLALGDYDLTMLAEEARAAWVEQIKGMYRDDPSSAVHGATGWLLRQWGYEEDAKAIEQREVAYRPGREWFTLEIKLPPFDIPSYFTFVVFEAGDYPIGSPDYEQERDSSDEMRRVVKITRRFAALDREITRGEFQAVTGFRGYSNERPWMSDPESAMAAANWYMVVDFCRKMTALRGFGEQEQGYANPESLDRTEFPVDRDARVSNAPRNWPVELDRAGFRIPTSAEFEIACRAGMSTSYGLGCDGTLLGRYGWYEDSSDNRGHPPRELRPNHRGLFDLHGNMYEWCHDWSGGNVAADLIDPKGPSGGSFRVLRGGAWRNNATFCRSAFPNYNQPTITNNDFGFRVVFSVSSPSRP